MPEAILLTGGTGTTGRRISRRLVERGASHLVATRTPRAANDIRFDWMDESTWNAALLNVDRVYLVAPSGVPDPLPAMAPFLTLAIRSGVKRFVLLSASSLEPGGAMMGSVHAWLENHAAEWVVLRPSWFMQNLSEGHHLTSIRSENAIYSATESGRVGFIDAEDIASMAVELLTRPTVASGDIILTGPDALSYDQVAQSLSDVLGRVVEHRRLSVGNLAARYAGLGLPQGYANTLASMAAAIAAGSENRVTDGISRTLGRPANSLADFVAANAQRWLGNLPLQPSDASTLAGAPTTMG